MELLNLYLAYFNNYKDEDDIILDSIKAYLPQLCRFVGNPFLRNVTERLLTHMLEKLYCTDIVVWPGGRNAILNEIRLLPNEYEEWPNPNANTNIFFVVAYLLFLHSRYAAIL